MLNEFFNHSDYSYISETSNEDIENLVDLELKKSKSSNKKSPFPKDLIKRAFNEDKLNTNLLSEV